MSRALAEASELAKRLPPTVNGPLRLAIQGAGIDDAARAALAAIDDADVGAAIAERLRAALDAGCVAPDRVAGILAHADHLSGTAATLAPPAEAA